MCLWDKISRDNTAHGVQKSFTLPAWDTNEHTVLHVNGWFRVIKTLIQNSYEEFE